MIVTDRFGSTSVSELVNIYTIERNIEHRESNEYEVYEIMFQFRRTESKDLISILWSYVMTSLGDKAYLELVCNYYKLHIQNKKCLLPKDDYNK